MRFLVQRIRSPLFATSEGRNLSPRKSQMTADDFELLIAAANKRLAVYREYRERLIGGDSPFFRSLLVQSDSRIRGCEIWLKELQCRLAETCKGAGEARTKPRLRNSTTAKARTFTMRAQAVTARDSAGS